MSLLKNLKEVVSKLQPSLPYLVMVGLLTSAELPFLLLLPVILELGEWSWNWYSNRNNMFTLEVQHYDPSGGTIHTYKMISFLMDHHKLLESVKKRHINQSISNSNQKIKMGTLVLTTHTPLIEPGIGFKIPFQHDNFNVQIELMEYTENEKKCTKYVITSTQQQDLNAFIKYTNELELLYFEKMYHEDKVPTLYQLHRNEFKPNTFNVKKTFRNIFLSRLVKEQLKAKLDAFINGKERYDELGIAYRTGYLLYGTPGNGKSSLIFAIAYEYQRDLYKINLNLSKDDFLNQIKNVQPNSMVVFEDIDTCPLTNQRDGKEEAKMYTDINLGDLLEVLDGYCYLNGCIVIMTTNHIEQLDPALIRPGRIDHKIELTNASSEQIEDIIHYFFKQKFKKSTNLNISVSELINTVIMPNLDNYEAVYDFLIKGNKFN